MYKIILYLSFFLTGTCIINVDTIDEAISIDRYILLTKGSHWTYIKKKRVMLGLQNKSVYHDMWRAPERENGSIIEVSYKITLSVNSVQKIDDLLIVNIDQKDDTENTPAILLQYQDKVFMMLAKDIDLDYLKTHKESLDNLTPNLFLPLCDISHKEFIIDQKSGKKGIYTVKKVGEITTPAGIFKDCLMVSIETDLAITEDVYAPDVGMVKEEHQAKDKSCYVAYTLEDYKVF